LTSHPQTSSDCTPFNIFPADPLDMDTSTLSLTERTPRHGPATFQTSSLSRELPEPEPDWYTRFLSPLTHVYSKAPSPESTQIMSLSSSNKLQEQYPISTPQAPTTPRTGHDSHGFSTVLLVFIPIIVVILTVLLGLVIFLVAVLYMRRRKGIQYVYL